MAALYMTIVQFRNGYPVLDEYPDSVLVNDAPGPDTFESAGRSLVASKRMWAGDAGTWQRVTDENGTLVAIVITAPDSLSTDGHRAHLIVSH